VNNILYGAELAESVRSVCGHARRRIWLAVPFIGNVETVRRLVGRKWLDCDTLDLRLIIDIGDRAYLNQDALESFARRGKVRSLPWLHAKVYLGDDSAIITSANLTNMAFSRRHEVGVRLDAEQVVQLETLYKWRWDQASKLSLDGIRQYRFVRPARGPRTDDDRGNASSRRMWQLPDDPGGGGAQAGGEFGDLLVFLDYYKEFAAVYEGIQRLWPSEPLWFETDNFLNYLLHECAGKPSEPFMRRPAREFGTEQTQVKEIARYAGLFATDPNRGPVEDWIRRKVQHSGLVQRTLAQSRLAQVTRAEVDQVVSGFNCYQSLALNKARFLNQRNNDLQTIREAWRELLYGEGSMSDRMAGCHRRLRWFGPSSIQELLGYCLPGTYPLRNRETDAGLRFFGYRISVR
jgi:hypothetical protein